MRPASTLSTTKRIPEKNTIESYSATLSKLRDHLGNSRQLDEINSEEILSFLNKITEGGKQQTKHGRYSHLKAFFNFIRVNIDSTLPNPCDTPMLRKLYRPGKPNHWNIVEKETIDEIIFRTTKVRNRLILELMARGGMRIGEPGRVGTALSCPPSFIPRTDLPALYRSRRPSVPDKYQLLQNDEK